MAPFRARIRELVVLALGWTKATASGMCSTISMSPVAGTSDSRPRTGSGYWRARSGIRPHLSWTTVACCTCCPCPTTTYSRAAQRCGAATVNLVAGIVGDANATRKDEQEVL